MEQRMAKMETHLEHLLEDMKELKADLKQHIQWEEKKYVEMDNKYAPKWVQTIAVVTIGTVGVAAIELIFGIFTKLIGG